MVPIVQIARDRFTFSQSVRKETNSIERTRIGVDAGLGLSSFFPLSTTLLRKLEDSDKTVKKAQKLIADYKRSTQVLDDMQRFENKSLVATLEEVKGCRYLCVVERKEQRSTRQGGGNVSRFSRDNIIDRPCSFTTNNSYVFNQLILI